MTDPILAEVKVLLLVAVLATTACSSVEINMPTAEELAASRRARIATAVAAVEYVRDPAGNCLAVTTFISDRYGFEGYAMAAVEKGCEP